MGLTQMQLCGKSSSSFLDEKALAVILDIIKRGGDAEIRRRGDGFIILEVTKKIKYST